jgi:hypothetical protein
MVVVDLELTSPAVRDRTSQRVVDFYMAIANVKADELAHGADPATCQSCGHTSYR